MSHRIRYDIQQYADKCFSVKRKDLQPENSERKQIQAITQKNNSGAYLLTMIRTASDALTAYILALADCFVEAHNVYLVPSDHSAVFAFRERAKHLVAGTVSRIRGEMTLRSVRTRSANLAASAPWHLQIEQDADTAIQAGELRLIRQRVAFTHSNCLGERQRIHIMVADPGALLPGREYPRFMYHATKPPAFVNGSQEEAALGNEWSRGYIFQQFPKVKYH